MSGERLPRDHGGWRALVRRVARVTRDPQGAEDLLHTAFLRLEEYRARQVVENSAAFLVRVDANIAVDEKRHARVRREFPKSIHELIDLTDGQPLHDEVLATRERLERVKAGLAELSPRTREIFLMHRIDGLKYREIAARLGITVSAVEKHVAMAAIDYEFALFGLGSLAAHLDANYSNGYRSYTSDLSKNSTHLLLNARLTLGEVRFGSNSELSVSLWGKNLTNQSYCLYDFDAMGRGLTGAQLAYFNVPRTWGAEVSFRF